MALANGQKIKKVLKLLVKGFEHGATLAKLQKPLQVWEHLWSVFRVSLVEDDKQCLSIGSGVACVNNHKPSRHTYINSSSAHGGGGCFKNRKPIGEVGCCEPQVAERIHWWTERWFRYPIFLSLSFSFSLFLWLSTYLSMYLPMYLFIYLPIYLSIYSVLFCSILFCSVLFYSILSIYLSL